MSDHEKTLDIIFGRWRSQILYVRGKLGVFDCVTSIPKNAADHFNIMPLRKFVFRLLKLDVLEPQHRGD
jgi:hypothetical protein